jgi:tripartite-type tricarboxylate transporter receptor subunit TctC
MRRLARPILSSAQALALLAAAVLTVAVPAAAQTRPQAWPRRPLTMVVPYAPGGSTDLIARLVAPGLAAALDQPVLIENMSGVGGIAGVSRVAKAAADGYEFVVGNVGTHAQNQFLFAYPPYDAAVEFTVAARLVDQAMLIAVRPDLRSQASTSSSPVSRRMAPACNTRLPASARRRILPVHC